MVHLLPLRICVLSLMSPSILSADLGEDLAAISGQAASAQSESVLRDYRKLPADLTVLSAVRDRASATQNQDLLNLLAEWFSQIPWDGQNAEILESRYGSIIRVLSDARHPVCAEFLSKLKEAPDLDMTEIKMWDNRFYTRGIQGALIVGIFKYNQVEQIDGLYDLLFQKAVSDNLKRTVIFLSDYSPDKEKAIAVLRRFLKSTENSKLHEYAAKKIGSLISGKEIGSE